MSQIFDALQRSEAERNGKGAGSDPRATDLLQRAESTAAAGRVAVGSAQASWNAVVSEDSDVAVAVAEQGAEPAPPISGERMNGSPVARAENRVEGPMECEVLKISPTPESHLVALPDNVCPASEAFHLLGVRLRHLRRQRTLKKVLITSTVPQEGKSVVAANLACTLALRTQQRVLLLEGDIRRPTQSKIFGIAEKPGICAWLNGEIPLIKSMYRVQGPGIWILPAGMATGNSLELLQSGRVLPMMEQLTNWFDWVVIDSPPVLPLADTSVWTNMADGILLVVRQGVTRKSHLQRGLDALGKQKLIGALLNSAKSSAHTDYYYRPSSRLPTDDADA